MFAVYLQAYNYASTLGLASEIINEAAQSRALKDFTVNHVSSGDQIGLRFPSCHNSPDRIDAECIKRDLEACVRSPATAFRDEAAPKASAGVDITSFRASGDCKDDGTFIAPMRNY